MYPTDPPPSSPHRSSAVGRWTPAIAAFGVLGVVAIAGLSSTSDGSSAPSTVSSNASTVLADPSLAPSTAVTIAPVVTEPAVTVPKTNLTSTIHKGSSGDEVTAVQQRLKDLGFDPGPVDGVFGSNSQQAVWAFETLVLRTPRAKATGKVTDDKWQTIQGRVDVAPRRPDTAAGSTHVEIYLPEQVLVVFTDNSPVMVAHIASGQLNPDGITPYHWCETLKYDTGPNGEPLDIPIEKQECADAKTPGGVFRFTRRYSGKRVGPLGGMMNPVYFNYGIAIHGADNVPLEPASHGCIRINQTLAKTFPSLVKNGDLVYVWSYDGKEPEQYTKRESLPSFNAANPDATTTSTTSLPPVSTLPSATTLPTATLPTATTKPGTPTTPTTIKPGATTTVPPATATTAPVPTTTQPAPTTAESTTTTTP